MLKGKQYNDQEAKRRSLLEEQNNLEHIVYELLVHNHKLEMEINDRENASNRRNNVDIVSAFNYIKCVHCTCFCKDMIINFAL